MDTFRRIRLVALCLPLALASSIAEAQDPDPVAVAAAPQAPDTGGDGFVANARRWADKHQIVGRLNGDVDGWYPRLGGMTRGGGFAFGPGYRTHVLDDKVLVDVSAAFSTKTYKAVDAKVRWVQAFNDRLEVWTNFRYEDFPQEDFFGTGLDSSLDTRTSYDLDGTNYTVRGLVKPNAWLRVGTTFGYARPDVGPGSDDNYPSIEELFTDAEAPGLAEQPNFMHTTFFGEIDLRDQPGNPSAGGFYRTSYALVDDRTLNAYDHHRFDAEATQYVPLTVSKRHVVSGRVGLSYVNNATGDRVPFYFLAYVGGVDTIRSFREFRFKDENALWMNLEYRYTIVKWVSAAAFFDAGKVSADWQDITLGGMKTGVGVGVRVHSEKQTFARIELGTGGGEGWQVFFKFGPSF